jgi:hypothetical protein
VAKETVLLGIPMELHHMAKLKVEANTRGVAVAALAREILRTVTNDFTDFEMVSPDTLLHGSKSASMRKLRELVASGTVVFTPTPLEEAEPFVPTPIRPQMYTHISDEVPRRMSYYADSYRRLLIDPGVDDFEKVEIRRRLTDAGLPLALPEEDRV